MPTYTYKREDGSTFDFEQRITEEPLKKCPTTGQSVKRVISGAAGLLFKGSGFYLTDYVKSGDKSGANGSKKEETKTSSETKESTSSKKESTTSTKSEGS